MAKVTIVIEDNKDGTVSMNFDPSGETILKMYKSGGHDVTPAHDYAIKIMKLAHDTHKANAGSQQQAKKLYL